MNWQLALAGLLVGILVGAIGMGGGSLLSPLLVLVFGYSPVVAVGTDIVHGAVFKMVGAARHRMMGTVQARLSGWMLLGSAPASLAGVWMAAWLRDRTGAGSADLQETVLGAALLLGAAGTAAKATLRFREAPDRPFILARRDRFAAILIGLFGGFVVGLTSIGSGVFFGLTMLIVFPLRSAKVVGTDIFHAAVLLTVAGAGHLLAGNVDIGAVGWLLLGSIPGVVLGSHLTLRVPDRTLRLVLSLVLGVGGMQLLHAEYGRSVYVAASAGAVLVLLLKLVLVPERRATARPREGSSRPDRVQPVRVKRPFLRRFSAPSPSSRS